MQSIIAMALKRPVVAQVSLLKSVKCLLLAMKVAVVLVYSKFLNSLLTLCC